MFEASFMFMTYADNIRFIDLGTKLDVDVKGQYVETVTLLNDKF